MRRRAFVVGCAALAGTATLERALAVAAQGPVTAGPRVRLVTEGRGALRASDIVPHRSYVFFYPFEGTPCFLLNLARALPGREVGPTREGPAYAWEGGVGRDRSIVAYSAICPHAYTHPTREVAMIHYGGPDAPAAVAQRTGVITCCVHGSTFDPSVGAAPLQPPAEAPLAGILLEWEETTDALLARVRPLLPIEARARSAPGSRTRRPRSGPGPAPPSRPRTRARARRRPPSLRSRPARLAAAR